MGLEIDKTHLETEEISFAIMYMRLYIVLAYILNQPHHINHI